MGNGLATLVDTEASQGPWARQRNSHWLKGSLVRFPRILKIELVTSVFTLPLRPTVLALMNHLWHLLRISLRA